MNFKGVLMDEMKQASWDDRFWAWLIDFILIGILWHRIVLVMDIEIYGLEGALAHSILLFIYWTSLEGYRGQSLGKMILNIAVTSSSKEKVGWADAAVESFGKAFLLPIDCLVSWIAYRDSKQRLFNKISDTIVVRQMG